MWIAAGDTDAGLTHIDAEPHTWAHSLADQTTANLSERIVDLRWIGAAALREIDPRP